MSLRSDLQSRDFVFTAELNPPKSTDLSKLLTNATRLKGLVSAINITDNSGASMKMNSLAPSYLVQRETGIETIWQMTCRDRNRLALQSDLLGGWALGLRNILPLGGDPIDKGDHPDAGGTFDIRTEDLLLAVQKLKTGKDFNDNSVEVEVAGFDFVTGSAAHPGVPDLAGQRETMLRRLDLGVEFFQTQICFETEQITKFYESIGEELARKTLLGITPLKTLGQAKFIRDNIWGVDVPDTTMSAMEAALGSQDPKSDEAKQAQHLKGLELASELVDHCRSLGFGGVHLMAIGQETVLDRIIESFASKV